MAGNLSIRILLCVVTRFMFSRAGNSGQQPNANVNWLLVIIETRGGERFRSSVFLPARLIEIGDVAR